jgi:hypothetical protein
MTEPVYVVVVLVGARRAQYDEIAPAATSAHAHVVLVDVVAATLQHEQSAGRTHDVLRVAGHVGPVDAVATAEVRGRHLLRGDEHRERRDPDPQWQRRRHAETSGYG